LWDGETRPYLAPGIKLPTTTVIVLRMDDRRQKFEAQALPHLDAAYNLARWPARSPADADDIVQDAMLRAFRGFDGFRSGDAKPWLLAIVRNRCRNAGADARRRRS
jgi:RNA polymerase sigma-70 factor (ECF subfamily)